MLWRTLRSPWRLRDNILPRSTYLSTSTIAARVIPQALCIRRLHDQKPANIQRSSVIVRHARLVAEPVKDDKLQVDEPIKVAGLVRSIRKQKNVAFARIGDGSTLANIQAVFPDPQLAKEYVALTLKSRPKV